MQSILSIILSKDVIIAIASCVAGIMGSRYYSKIYSSKKKMTYTVNKSTILKDDLNKYEDIAVMYKGNQITDLYQSTVSFTNEGRIAVIEKNDIAPKKPLKCICTNGEILDCIISDDNKEEYGVSISKGTNQSEIIVNFDYINNLDCIKVEVLHTGNSLITDGRLKGRKKEIPMKKEEDFSMSIESYFLDLVVMLVSFLLIIAFVVLSVLHINMGTFFIMIAILFPFGGFLGIAVIKIQTIYAFYKNKRHK